MKYVSLFSVSVRHSYYTKGKCPDFVMEPTRATQRLLNNHRLIFKTEPFGLRVLVPVTAQQTPLIPLMPGTTLTFQMRLTSPGFPLFTDLAGRAGLSAPFYTNADATDLPRLSLTSRKASHTEQFEVVQPAAQETFTLSGKPLSGVAASAFTLKPPTDVSAVSAYDPTGNILTVNSTAATPGQRFSVTYPIRPRPPRGVFAEIDILYNNALPMPPNPAAAFEIAFSPRQVHWAYYLASSTAPTGSGFQVSQAANGEAASIQFPETNRTDLRQHPDPQDRVAKALAAQYPDTTIHLFRFISKGAVPCREAARKDLQLQLDGSELIPHLPNPSARNIARYTHDQGGVRQDALFHVIRYIRPPSPTSTS